MRMSTFFVDLRRSTAWREIARPGAHVTLWHKYKFEKGKNKIKISAIFLKFQDSSF